jgi:hypothetical protein
MNSRSFRWWLLAVDVVRSLTYPRTDVDALDGAFALRVRQSALFRAACALSDAVARAWMESRSRAAALRISADLPPPGRRLTIALGIAAVACVTAWLLDTFRTVLP